MSMMEILANEEITEFPLNSHFPVNNNAEQVSHDFGFRNRHTHAESVQNGKRKINTKPNKLARSLKISSRKIYVTIQNFI